ncbi:hypothetical protein LOAG_08102 [Loa loa]|uniref:Uncharacterized protein n=1 Tax=Loa loa TaxID=7209 RepID=A0A1S0TW28_LOALO|nr:hypothetical protein LOAG_08102 [Loa loa]EFO20388.1 hypothetical protein LOAG_08102 [Loa loa]
MAYLMAVVPRKQSIRQEQCQDELVLVEDAEIGTLRNGCISSLKKGRKPVSSCAHLYSTLKMSQIAVAATNMTRYPIDKGLARWSSSDKHH